MPYISPPGWHKHSLWEPSGPTGAAAGPGQSKGLSPATTSATEGARTRPPGEDGGSPPPLGPAPRNPGKPPRLSPPHCAGHVSSALRDLLALLPPQSMGPAPGDRHKPGDAGLGDAPPSRQAEAALRSAQSSQGPPPPSPTVHPPSPPHCPLAPAAHPALPRACSTCDQPGRVTHTCAPRSTHNHMPERTQLQPEYTHPRRSL